MLDQLPLFNSDDTAVADQLGKIFEQWLDARQNSPRPFRQSSINVYTAMWQSMSEYLISRNRDPLRASAADITTMLLNVGGSMAYQKRLLILFEDVTRTASAAGFISPVRELMKDPRYRFADSRSTEKVPITLNQIQEHELVKRLTKSIKEGSWKRQRDAAMAATILASGIKPGEALSLTADQIRFAGLDSTGSGLPEKFALQGNGNNGPRECPIAQWGQSILNEWLLTRERLKITAKYIFPSGLQDDQPIGKATLYRQFGKLLGELGITTPKRGAHLLRHTFAVRQLEQGKQQRKVQEWLGLEDFQSTEVYRKIARR